MDNEFSEKTAEVGTFVKCKGCASNLKYAPGTQHLKCEYCGAENEIVMQQTQVVEESFKEFLKQQASKEDKQDISIVKCDSCGASTTLEPNITSSSCPYCDTPLVIKNATTSSIVKPKYLLPFKVVRKQANEEFIKWVGGLWFAPGDLKQYAAHSTEKLRGMYMPYWTYDTKTITRYTGQRGEYYYDTESYTDSNGNTKERQVRRTRWYSAEGTVHNNFDDLLVCASGSLPEKISRNLEPWDLEGLIAYDDRYLSGFVTESYQIDLAGGFEKAKEIMQPIISTSVKSDIGGDEQRVFTTDSTYNHTTFKHILLPLWISAYRYNNKVYRFMINARTAEVQGERPYSAAKITLLVLSILAAGAAIWYFATQNQ